VVVTGAILLFVSFIFLMPRDSVTGSAAHRNVRLGWFSIEQTPGYQREELSRRSSRVRWIVGFGSLGLGILFIVLGL
jgi:hypothetical protein